MATLAEQFTGRTETLSDTSPSVEIEYVVRGASSESVVHATAMAGIPLEFYLPQGVRLERESIEISGRMTGSDWRVKARFEKPSAIRDEALSFEITGVPVHIETSIFTGAGYGPSVDASRVNVSSVIGWDGSTVLGTDILQPVYSPVVRKTVTGDVVTASFRAQLQSLCGHVNASSMAGYDQREILFLGASGSPLDTGKWDLVYKFAVRKHRYGFLVGDIAVVSMSAWNVMDVEYVDRVVNGRMLRVPVAVYSHQVYQTADFSILGVTSL